MEDIVVVARAHSLVAAAVPSCHRSVVAHVVKVEEACERVAHEVPACVLLVCRGVGFEVAVEPHVRQFAELLLLYHDRERAVCRCLEDISLSGFQIFLCSRQVGPSSLALLGSYLSVVVAEHEVAVAFYVASLDVEREAEEVPAVGSNSDVDENPLGIHVSLGNNSSPV